MTKERLLILFLFTLGAVSRAPFIELMQSHWDGPQYSIAIRQFDLSQETPAPPGYPIYIFLGWIVDRVVSDPHASLLYISVIFSGFSAALFFLVGWKIWNRRIGIVASLLFLSGPAFYYFGLTPYAYGLLPFFTLLLGLVVYLIVFKKKQLGIFLGLILGIYFGFRPQELPMFIPIGFFGFLYLNKKEKILSIVFFFITTLAWLVPLSNIVGGVEEYVSISISFFQSGAVEAFSFHKLLAHTQRMGKGLFLGFTLGSLVLLWFPYQFVKSKLKIHNRKRIVFFTIWILPSLLFNFFIRSDHAGYQIPYLTVLLLLTSYAFWEVFKAKRKLMYVFLAVVILFNLSWFFRDRDPNYESPYVPTSFHYSEIVKNDRIMTEKISYILDNFDHKRTVVVVKSESFRPVMYYLKNYQVLNLNFVETEDPRYSSLVRIGYNWDQNEMHPAINQISFSPEIETIVFYDDEFTEWTTINSFKRINLSYNQAIAYSTVKKNTVYAYSFHSFYEL